MRAYDIVIIGGGLGRTCGCNFGEESGVDSVLILERDKELMNLNQCIHNGFGPYTFKEELTDRNMQDVLLIRRQNRILNTS